MKISSTEQLMTVHGRISSVRWLEDPPWNARKKRGSKYAYYELIVPTNQVQELARLLEGEEYEQTGVWTEVEEIFVHEPPHPAYQGFADYLRAHPSAARELTLGRLLFGPKQVDNDDCQEFCLLQLEKLLRALHRLGAENEEQEVRLIRAEVESQGGEAYGRFRPRLQELQAFVSQR